MKRLARGASLGFGLALALVILAGSCSSESDTQTGPLPGDGSATGILVFRFSIECPGWTNVPVYDGMTQVGLLTVPGDLRLVLSQGKHRLTVCSPDGPELMTVDVTPSLTPAFVPVSLPCTGPPCP